MAKILVIDDKQDNLIAISALLPHLIPECRVITAQSGPEGMEKAKDLQPDTILLDIKMPGMDGFEVCERLKSDRATKHIPILMLTAIKTDPKNRIKGLELGADAFLTKPIDEAEMAAQVKVMLRIKRAEDLLREKKDRLETLVRDRTKALRESEEKYRSIFETAANLITSVDRHGVIVDCNNRIENFLGYTKDEIIGQSMKSLIHPDDHGKAVEASKEVLSRGFSHNKECRMVRKEGTPIDVSINFSALKDASENVERTICIIDDITDRKQAEEEKQNLQVRLLQAQKMEAIGTLAGGIAHDFNNVLGAIIGYAEIMEMFDVPEDSPMRGRLRQVLQAGYRAKDLVRQILTFSRQTEQEPVPLELNSILNEGLKFLRASLPKTIEIRQNLEHSPATVLADPTQMHQVLMNLGANAAHAMRETGGVLEVSLSETVFEGGTSSRILDLEPGPYIEIGVSDTGHGMSEKIMERIFEPYFTTKKLGEGTGMGLALVHGIVTSHGGAITVESEEGKGTTFHVFLPKREEEKVQPRTRKPGLVPSGTERILLVDDEKALVDLGKSMLERIGYKVVAKTSSLDALEVFREQPQGFDLVISDQTMPQMTGFELAKKIIQIRPDIPVILSTGYSETATPEKAKAIGIREFLMKPLGAQKLAETVRKVLDANPHSPSPTT